MQLIEAFRLALSALWANKLRSILTLLGVIIGVGSVIMVVTLTNGAKGFVTSKINSYGASVLTISNRSKIYLNSEIFCCISLRLRHSWRSRLVGCRPPRRSSAHL